MVEKQWAPLTAFWPDFTGYKLQICLKWSSGQERKEANLPSQPKHLPKAQRNPDHAKFKGLLECSKSSQIAIEFKERQDIMGGNVFCAIKRKKKIYWKIFSGIT